MARAPSVLPARIPALDFSSVSHRWFGGSSLATALVNGLNVLFPSGERFLLRAARPYLDLAAERDPILGQRLRGFFAQEAKHFSAHEQFLERLRELGYEVDPFLTKFRAIAFDRLEPMAPRTFRLATAVAFEHLFATVAASALRSGVVEREAVSPMDDLLLWHAAEEIEHKSVLFDVLQEVAPAPGIRALGMLAALSIYVAFVGTATVAMLRQDPEARLRTVLSELRRGATLGAVSWPMFVRSIASYMRSGFHPDEVDDYALARTWLGRLGFADAGV